MLFKFLRDRRAKRQEEEMKVAIEERMRVMALDPDAFKIEVNTPTGAFPSEATATFNDIKNAVESVTAEKQQARRSVRRILDLLPGKKKER
jgi:hypothetical protein